MEVEKLELADFRNYPQTRVELSSGLNLVLGRNGQGKTNLLEALYLLCSFGSHRVSQLAPLIRTGADRAVVRALGRSRGRRLEVDAEVRGAGGLRLRVNRVSMRAPEVAEGGFAAVLFSPEDLAVVKGPPEERRRFIDRAAAQVRPRAARQRLEFDRILRQRNGALRAAEISSRARESLEVWDEQWVEAATAVVLDRCEVLDELAPRVRGHYQDVSGDEGPRIDYRASWVDGDPPEGRDAVSAALRSALDASRPRDLERGLTNTGPHRDDLDLRLGGADVRTFASQGEQRSVALALRLAERDLIAAVRGEDPILLLDDVFSELDEGRRSRLAALIAGSRQTITTATDPAGVPVAPQRSFWVRAGEVKMDE